MAEETKKKQEEPVQVTRKGFTLNEFVTSCSTCMGKEGLLEDVAREEVSTKE